jgi:hypothetical protein
MCLLTEKLRTSSESIGPVYLIAILQTLSVSSGIVT